MPDTENLSEPTTTAPLFATPAMSAEPETELIESSRPVRISGFLALILGLLSFSAIFGAPLIVVPVLAVVCALIALRPYGDQRPAGYGVAMIGLFAAVLFAAWGVTQRHFHQEMMTTQAVRFAENWLDLLAQGDVELAVELRAHPASRQSETMPLDQYYSESTEGRAAMSEFREKEPVEAIIRAAQQADWELSQPAIIYHQFGRELVKTIWRDRSAAVKEAVAIDLEYLPATTERPAQWRVENIDVYYSPPS